MELGMKKDSGLGASHVSCTCGETVIPALVRTKKISEICRIRAVRTVVLAKPEHI